MYIGESNLDFQNNLLYTSLAENLYINTFSSDTKSLSILITQSHCAKTRLILLYCSIVFKTADYPKLYLLCTNN